mmetsp:Transcript_11735/g.38608  ORF Transcript_11735/g.38608 Transcript_11735/m.38608 type:complete len:185 (-) Transcript_11735:74-628(-)
MSKRKRVPFEDGVDANDADDADDAEASLREPEAEVVEEAPATPAEEDDPRGEVVDDDPCPVTALNPRERESTERGEGESDRQGDSAGTAEAEGLGDGGRDAAEGDEAAAKRRPGPEEPSTQWRSVCTEAQMDQLRRQIAVYSHLCHRGVQMQLQEFGGAAMPPPAPKAAGSGAAPTEPGANPAS